MCRLCLMTTGLHCPGLHSLAIAHFRSFVRRWQSGLTETIVPLLVEWELAVRFERCSGRPDGCPFEWRLRCVERDIMFREILNWWVLFAFKSTEWVLLLLHSMVRPSLSQLEWTRGCWRCLCIWPSWRRLRCLQLFLLIIIIIFFFRPPAQSL